MNDKIQEKKLKILNAFIYKANMMRRSFYRLMASSFHFQNNKVDEDLMVSFLTHSRVFYSFFFRPKSQGAYAGDFIDWSVKEDNEMKKWYKQINKFLLHLDEKRSDYKPYPIMKIYNYIRNLIIYFIECLPQEFKKEKIIKLQIALKEK